MKSERDWRIIPVLLTALSRARDSFVYDLPSVFHPPSPSPFPSSSTSPALFPHTRPRAASLPLSSPSRSQHAGLFEFHFIPWLRTAACPRVPHHFFLSVSAATPLTAYTRTIPAFVPRFSLSLSLSLSSPLTLNVGAKRGFAISGIVF